MTLDLKYLERKLDKALKNDNMKHTIKNINGQPMCQAVNPYSQLYEHLSWKTFKLANPAFHFIHPYPLPDNSIVDGQDLTEPFWEFKSNGNKEWKKIVNESQKSIDRLKEKRQSVAFKYPQMMSCIDGVFIRKEQPDNFDQLYDILAALKSFKINIDKAIDLINKVRK